MKNLVILVITLAVLVQTAYSIKCYVCTKSDGNCESGETDCTSLLNRCMKVTNTKTKAVAKSCGSEGLCSTAEDACKNNNCEVSCCEGDKCNASVNMKPFVVMSLIVPFLAYFMM